MSEKQWTDTKMGKIKCKILTHQRVGVFEIYLLHISISVVHSENKGYKVATETLP